MSPEISFCVVLLCRGARGTLDNNWVSALRVLVHVQEYWKTTKFSKCKIKIQILAATASMFIYICEFIVSSFVWWFGLFAWFICLLLGLLVGWLFCLFFKVCFGSCISKSVNAVHYIPRLPASPTIWRHGKNCQAAWQSPSRRFRSPCRCEFRQLLTDRLV